MPKPDAPKPVTDEPLDGWGVMSWSVSGIFSASVVSSYIVSSSDVPEFSVMARDAFRFGPQAGPSSLNREPADKCDYRMNVGDRVRRIDLDLE